MKYMTKVTMIVYICSLFLCGLALAQTPYKVAAQLSPNQQIDIVTINTLSVVEELADVAVVNGVKSGPHLKLKIEGSVDVSCRTDSLVADFETTVSTNADPTYRSKEKIQLKRFIGISNSMDIGDTICALGSFWEDFETVLILKPKKGMTQTSYKYEWELQLNSNSSTRNLKFEYDYLNKVWSYQPL